MERLKMIPLEKLIPIEKKARECGYSTEIYGGGSRVTFSKYISGDTGSYKVCYDDTVIELWSPSTTREKIEDYEDVLCERNKALELAKMLRDAAQDNLVSVIGPSLIKEDDLKVHDRVGVVENYKIEPIGEIANVKGDLIYVQTYGENYDVWMRKSDVVGIPIEIGDLDYNENMIAVIISELGVETEENASSAIFNLAKSLGCPEEIIDDLKKEK
jgi:hypothetical protein